MNNEINMHYRFISDEEPSEEQLAFLMQDVGREIMKQKSDLQSMVLKNILLEYQNAKKLFPNL